MNKATNKKAPRLEEKARGGIEATPASVAHFDGPASVETSPMLDAALSLAESGFSVLPLLTGTKRPFKGSHGVHDATRNRTQIRQWWMQTPTANIGLATGKVSGCFALDVDAKSGGLDSLARLVSEHGPLAETPRQATPNGGEHYLFQWPGFKVRNPVSTIAPGIDIRGDGGYIVVTPSVLDNGRCYQWIADPRSTPLAPAPEWLLKTINPEHPDLGQRDGSNISVSLSLCPNSAGESLCLSVPTVEDAIRLTLPEDQGQRHRRIFMFARALRAIPEYANADALDLRPLVERWHRAALPKIQTKDFDETWADFRIAWPRITHPLGAGPMIDALERARRAESPTCASAYDGEATHLLIKLCRELQTMAGAGPFHLSARIAGDALGIPRMCAHRLLSLLVADGVLEVVEKGTKTKATRYRFKGEL